MDQRTSRKRLQFGPGTAGATRNHRRSPAGRCRAVIVLLLGALLAGAGPAPALRTSFGLIETQGAPPAVAFTLPGVDGKPLSLKDFRGRTVLLNFWATWCPPCRVEMPSMQALYDKYRDKGLTILAVSVDKQGAAIVTPFLKQYKLTFPVALDVDMKVMDQYGVRGLPSTFVIDAQGRQRGMIIGPRDWNSKEAKELVEELLAEARKSAPK